MEIRPESLLHIARLAKIRLNEQEIARFTDNLNAALHSLAPLLDVPTDGVEPSTHAPTLMDEQVAINAAQQDHLREDLVEQRLSPEDIVRNAPDVQDGHFRVPKVVED